MSLHILVLVYQFCKFGIDPSFIKPTCERHMMECMVKQIDSGEEEMDAFDDCAEFWEG